MSLRIQVRAQFTAFLVAQVEATRFEPLATVTHEFALFRLQQCGAVGAFEVSGDMLLHVALAIELLVANSTAEGFFARVNALMPSQIGVGFEGRRAKAALFQLLCHFWRRAI